ncbi:endo-1,4-beta-xylanase [Schaalia vaccimaxillae]|uniref:endo-1,4-beta-xylanase n=1 Tax=Schaalia vaccimaxillae TaxID=183916 RepID=UPI0003B42E86|nr:endo-1,4-beta-xylanase [Schaalia vaccimaxillae]
MGKTLLPWCAARRVGVGLAAAVISLTGLTAPVVHAADAPGADPAANAQDEGAVVNTTFEDGTTGPWNARGSASLKVSAQAARTGERGLVVSGRTANWHGVEMPIIGNLIPGQSYRVSGWVRLAPGTPATDVFITAGENNENYVRVAQVSANDGWMELSGTYTVGAGVTSGSLYFEAASETASFDLDDVRVTGAVAGDQTDEDGDNDGADTGNTGDCPAAQASTKPVGVDLTQSLYKSLPFPLGAAVSSYAVNEAQARAALDHNFNQVTPENFMKVETWYDEPWKFVTNNAEANALMDWGAQTGNRVYGHVLVWHSQTPDWFFQDDQGKFLTNSPEHQQIARDRMRTHINNVAQYLSDRYGKFGSDTNPLVAFDVVNEVIADGANPQSNGLRTSYWYQILGEEFIDLAFRYADEAFNSTYAAPESDRPVTLFINEYNTENGTGTGTKTQRYRALVERLLARGVPVDGVGHQFHASLSTNVANLGAALDYFDSLPVVQAVTEMDVPTGSPVTEDVLRRQGAFYRSAFDIFRAQQAENGNLFSVTVWGLADNKSWRTCSGAPLLFDNDYDGKWAYIGVLGGNIPRESQSLTVFGAADAADATSGTWKLMRATKISDSASFQARWNSSGVVVRVDITDADAGSADAVTLSSKDRSFVISRNGGSVEGLEGVRVESDDRGWYAVATIPMTGLKVGDQVPFEVSVAGSDADGGWNGAGAQGALILAEDLKSAAAPKTETAPVLDGVIDAEWDRALRLSTDQQIEGESGASADVRAMWSQNGESSTLHLLFEVADSTPDVSSSEVHEQDSVEVFLDLGNLKAQSYQDTDMQLRVNSDNVTTFGTGDVGAQQKRVTSAVVKNDSGYVVEIAIDLLDRGGDGTVHGFDVQVNDGVSGKRGSVRNWADPTGNSWRSPSHWGVLELAASEVDVAVPTVVVDDTEVEHGQTITITGTAFAPGQDVVATFHSDPVVIGTAAADETGRVVFTFVIPADAAIGGHRVVLVQDGSGLSAETGLTVVKASLAGAPGEAGSDLDRGRSLAATGANAAGAVLFGVVLAALGGALVVGHRRMRA